MNPSTPSSRTLVIEREMPHPPQKIWRALTEGSLMEKWLLPNDFQPVIGNRFTLRTKSMPQWDGVIESKLLEIEPHHRLSYRWNALGLKSVVTWTLTPTDGGTLVRMEHSGFRSEEGADYKGANYGWQKFIGNLNRLVAELT